MPGSFNGAEDPPPSTRNPDWARSVRSELERVLANPAFARSERLSAFFRLLVEEALEGRSPLNEYRIATEVYHRKPDFDPQTDSIVRVEAGRLRQKLADYYRSEGQDDSVAIDLPPRTYVPVFRGRELPKPQAPASPVAAPPPIGRLRFNRKSFRFAAITVAAAVLVWIGLFSSRVRDMLAGYQRLPAIASAGTISIAVLPFEDFSQAKDQEYFADGLSDEIIDALSTLPGLNVIARTSSSAYRRKAGDVRKFGAELNANVVLEGSVRKQGDRVRIAAQLIDVSSGFHLWSHTYERSFNDTFAVQHEIAVGIANALRVELTPSQHGAPTARYAPKLETYNLYLQGMHYARRWSAEALTKAIGLFEEAVRKDPKFAAAWAELAETRCVLGIHAGFPPNDVMPQAKAAALKALELDDGLADAHASLGLVKGIYEWDWAGAEKEFLRSHELDPSDPNIHEAYVMGYLLPTGHLDEALTQVNEARTFDPVSTRISSVQGMVHYYRRDYDKALAAFHSTLELEPHFFAAHLAIGAVYDQQGMYAQALEELYAGRPSWESGIGRSSLAYTYARMGEKQNALALLNELTELSQTRYISAPYIALIYLGLGDKNRALEWLNKGYEQHSATLAYLKVNPRYDTLRPDPRFIALLKRIGLA